MLPCPPPFPTKVLDGEVCWHKSQYHHLHEMFRSRELLHREVYTAP